MTRTPRRSLTAVCRSRGRRAFTLIECILYLSVVMMLSAFAGYVMLDIVRLTTRIHQAEEQQWQWSRARAFLAADVWQASSYRMLDNDTLEVARTDGRTFTWDVEPSGETWRLSRTLTHVEAGDAGDTIAQASWAAAVPGLRFETDATGVVLHVEPVLGRPAVSFTFPAGVAHIERMHDGR